MKKRANGDGTLKSRIKNGKVVGWRGAITVMTLNGNSKRLWFSGKTRDEVMEKRDKAKVDIAKGLNVIHEKFTVADLLQQWVEYKKRDTRANTSRDYRDVIRLYLAPRIGRIRLERLQTLDVERMVSGLMADGKSAAIAKRSLNILRMALRQAMRWDMIGRNVAENVKPPKVEVQQMLFWSPREVLTFLEIARGHALYPAFFLALFTGMRIGEFLGLRWQDVNLDTGEITVQQTLVVDRKDGADSRGRLGFNAPKSKNGVRVIAINPDVVQVLRDHKAAQDAWRLEVGGSWVDMGLVFATRCGTPSNPRNFQRIYDNLLEQSTVSLRRIRIHDFRHTAASLMILKGAGPKEVCDTLGHADVAFTMQRYVHLFAQQKRKFALSLADLSDDSVIGYKSEAPERVTRAANQPRCDTVVTNGGFCP